MEHEYAVELDGRQVDFRALIHELPLPGRRTDAIDPHAYRGAWGGTLTADGREAEVATPPSTVGPFVGQRAAGLAETGAEALRAALPGDAILRGFSTHLSVEVPRGTEARAARYLANHHGPTVAWLLDGPASPGSCSGRASGAWSSGGDFIDGQRLALAAVFAIGLVRDAVERTGCGSSSSIGWAGCPGRGRALSSRSRRPEPSSDTGGSSATESLARLPCKRGRDGSSDTTRGLRARGPGDRLGLGRGSAAPRRYR